MIRLPKFTADAVAGPATINKGQRQEHAERQSRRGGRGRHPDAPGQQGAPGARGRPDEAAAQAEGDQAARIAAHPGQ
ncbi:hypothetical protein G6F40_016727 [Rhizopus arrhizus]|nr:hypothetical protein G6F40_016727 [Rhizopus arrhizus]